MPEYADANVTTTLTSAEWNGSTGGILVLQADLLTLNANLDVSGKGFRGGNAGNFLPVAPQAQEPHYTILIPSVERVAKKAKE